MKLGVSLSSAAHVALLAWGLVTFSAPAPLQVADVEALPIDIVPIEELTKAVQGDRKAALSDKPAPTPTQRPDRNEPAEHIGEAEKDLKSEPEAKPADMPVETAKAEAPPPSPIPTPTPQVEPDVQPAPEDAPAPTTELASVNDAAVPVTEQPAAEETPSADESEQFASLENVAVVPTKRPEPPKPKSAETKERKKQEKPATTKSASSADKKESVTDEIASLLNKQEPASSGAKRSSEQASLGTRKASTGEKLSTSEMDALKAQLATCWSIPAGAAGADELTASVDFELDASAQLVGKPRVSKTSGNAAFDGSAVRAIQKCNQQGFNLPSGKYDAWAQITVNFDPRDMF
ncbi:MAG: TonB C-terminal domain-containing protein [Nitratireductor sp.]|nr:TonB C-terminal domain-containing protein [Nitratireductor sp.]